MAQHGTLVDENTVVRISWRGWRVRLAKWRLEQAKFMPAIGLSPASQPLPQASDDSPLADGDTDYESDDETDENDPESHAPNSTSSDEEVLGLPSDFSPNERKTYEIELLAEYETKLRIGQAFDQLEKIREAVKHLSAFIEEKKEVHAVADHVRSNDITKYSVAYSQKLARQYNHNFNRLVALRGQLSTLERSHPASRLQRIDLANDLKIANLKKAREQGDHTQSGSWIWSVFEDVMDCVDAKEAQPSKPQASGRALYTTWCTYFPFPLIK